MIIYVCWCSRKTGRKKGMFLLYECICFFVGRVEIFEVGHPKIHQVRLACWDTNWINDCRLRHSDLGEYDQPGWKSEGNSRRKVAQLSEYWDRLTLTPQRDQSCNQCNAINLLILWHKIIYYNKIICSRYEKETLQLTPFPYNFPYCLC